MGRGQSRRPDLTSSCRARAPCLLGNVSGDIAGPAESPSLLPRRRWRATLIPAGTGGDTAALYQPTTLLRVVTNVLSTATARTLGVSAVQTRRQRWTKEWPDAFIS